MVPNYYDILGVSTSACKDEIKKAFRKLALVYHPDKSTGDRNKYEQIQEAYQFLVDDEKRKIYDASLNLNTETIQNLLNVMLDMIRKQFDMTRQQTSSTTTATHPPSSEPKKKVDPIIVKITVTLDELYRGDIKKVVVRVRRGEGWKKHTIYINLMEHKTRYIFSDQGDHMYGEMGDIIVNIHVKENEYVKRDKILCEYDLYIEEHISLYEFIYGTEVNLKFLNDEIITIHTEPMNESDGMLIDKLKFYKMHIIDEQGLPYIENNQVKYGSLYVYFYLILKFPDNNNEEVKTFLKLYFNDVVTQTS
jgi:DnaJ-class molecular chaperone